MDIGAHREITTFQVAKLQHHEAILGMPWLKKHNPRIDWGQGKITFDSERCTTMCLKESPTVYAIPEAEALEENLVNRFSTIQAKKDKRILVKKMNEDAKILTKGTRGAAGHDLYAIEDKTIPARGQQVVKTGISLRLPNGTYGRIAPRSGLAVKHGITVNAGVIDQDYTGEIGEILVNLFNYDYHVQQGERIAQLIPEKVLDTQCQEVTRLEDTKRGTKGFGSTDTRRIEIDEISTKTFERSKRQGDEDGLLWGRYNNGKLEILATNISTELAIQSKKGQRKKDLSEIVPEEYWDYQRVFEEEEATGLPPHRPGVDLEINIEKGGRLPLKKIYPLGAKQLEELGEYIRTNKKRKWIRDSFADGGLPIMFMKKKDGKLRLCVDYRELNDITKKDRYPLPLIGEALDRLQGAKFFTKLDIKDAYHNIRIREGDEWKTTFTTKLGTYEYQVMPFGLCNAPAAFQRWINRTLHQFVDICCIVYLDDVLIYSKTKSEHIRDIRAILKAIEKSGMKIKPGKCEFHATETEYLGFIIGREGIKVDPIKTSAIWDWAKPTKVKEIQRFTGFCNFYRRFIEGFSSKARPLYQLTRKDKKWKWGKEEDKAFDEIRTHLTSAPTLIHFDPQQPITIETDASSYVTAGILSQPGKDGKLHPVAYRSKTMTKAECNYDVHDKELLAIVKALEKLATIRQQYRTPNKDTYGPSEPSTIHDN